MIQELLVDKRQAGRQALRKMVVGSLVLSSISKRNKNKRKTAEKENFRKSSDTQKKKPLNNREATTENSLAKWKQTKQQKQLETQKNQRKQKSDQKLVKQNKENPKQSVIKPNEKKQQPKDPLPQSKNRIEQTKKKQLQRQPAKIRNLDSLYKKAEVKYFQPKLGPKPIQLDNTKESLNQFNQKKTPTKVQKNTIKKSLTPKTERDGIHGNSLNQRVENQKRVQPAQRTQSEKQLILQEKG